MQPVPKGSERARALVVDCRRYARVIRGQMAAMKRAGKQEGQDSPIQSISVRSPQLFEPIATHCLKGTDTARAKRKNKSAAVVQARRGPCVLFAIGSGGESRWCRDVVEWGGDEERVPPPGRR